MNSGIPDMKMPVISHQRRKEALWPNRIDGLRYLNFKAAHDGIELLGDLTKIFGADLDMSAAAGHFARRMIDGTDIS